MTATRCEVVGAGELGEAERARWEALRSGVPSLESPFLSSAFTAHVGEVRPDARVAVLQSDGATGIAGFLPFHASPTRLGRPIGRRLANAQGAVVDPSTEWDPRAVVRRCRLRALAFDQLVPGQPAFAPFVAATDSAMQMDLGGGFDAYLATARQRGLDAPRAAARSHRRLVREHGVHFVWDDRDPAALKTMLRWKSAQYRRTGAYDQMQQPWVVELIERLHASDDPQCSGILCSLHLGGELAAATIVLRSGTHLAGWFGAYDPRWAKHSPGSVMQMETARSAAAAGVRTFDLGKGGEDYKKCWATDRLPLQAAVVHAYPGGSVVTAAARTAQDLVRRTPAKAFARRLRWRIAVG
jgi:CelD/BcsL family acetyltransferase involved in cellulose biosynthesis